MSILQELETPEAQYDEYVKRILSNRYILAWILKHTTEEFNGVSIKQIAEECIAEDISISKVRVMPGKTNTDNEGNTDEKTAEGAFNDIDVRTKTSGREEGRPERILGMNTEDKVPGEGAIYYDIRFSAYASGKEELTKILLNVEAQKTFQAKYALVTRGIFYAARMISAQKDTEFTASNYSDMKKVYSIWICMNVPNNIGNAIAEYSIRKQDIIKGIPDVREDYDKMSIVMIYLNGTKKGRDKGAGLIGLLNTLLTTDLTVGEKKEILQQDYGIEIEERFGKEMDHMCNLGEGIREDALKEGIEKGIKKGIEKGIKKGESRKLIEMVCRKLSKQKTPDIIADELEEEPEIIRSICEVAESFAPDYDCNKVYEAWEKVKEKY